MKKILERVERNFNQTFIITKNERIIDSDNVLFFYYESNNVYAVTETEKHVISENINDLVEKLKGRFFRTHRYYFVNFDRIKGVSRYLQPESMERVETPEYHNSMDYIPSGEMASDEAIDRGLRKNFTGKNLRVHEDFLVVSSSLKTETFTYQLHLHGSMEKVPVSPTYQGRIKKALGVRTFDHLVPDNPIARKLRELQLTDFGFREISKLDKDNPEQVAKFIEKWDIKKFSRERMLKYFRRITSNEIDKPLIIRNIIWQLYRWISWGIYKPQEGNIRSLWYKIKAVLSYHSKIFDNNDVTTFYQVLTTMIEKDKLFSYKDFQFLDMNEPYRGIGKKKPEIILASEKVGHFHFIRRLAAEIECSFICLRGEPSHISMEYFSDDLSEIIPGDKKVSVFSITDLDPAGDSIAGNLVRGLERNKVKVEKLIELVNISAFEPDEIEFFRFPVVRYEKKGNDLIPLPPANKSHLTKTLRWYFGKMNEESRLFSKEKIEGRFVYTIWGIESDAADRMIIRQKFLKVTHNGSTF